MTWKTIPHHKVPYWARRKRRAHVRGRNYLYRRNGKVWQSKLRSEWQDKTPKTPKWVYLLEAIVVAVIAGLIIKLI